MARRAQAAHNAEEAPRAPPEPRPSRKILPVHGLMFRRRGELVRLAAFRAAHGVTMVDPTGWALVIADIALHGWGGLDGSTFDRVTNEVARAWSIQWSPDVLAAGLRRVADLAARKGRRYRPFNAVAAGRLIDLVTEERLALEIRTLTGVDETTAERRERSAEDRRKKEAERKRRKRTAEGCQQRPVYEAASAEKTRPWEKMNVSRSTWFRKGKPMTENRSRNETGVSADNTEEGNLCADALVSRSDDRPEAPATALPVLDPDVVQAMRIIAAGFAELRRLPCVPPSGPALPPSLWLRPRPSEIVAAAERRLIEARRGRRVA